MWFKEKSIAGIYGGLPEISFKNLKRVTLHSKSLDNVREMVLFVESIWKVTVEKEVFGNTSYNASFTDIADLNLNEDFLKSSVQKVRILYVFINRCHITQMLPARAVTLTEFRIENSDVEVIRSNAFASQEIDSFIMNNVKIQLIEKNIFRDVVSIITTCCCC